MGLHSSQGLTGAKGVTSKATHILINLGSSWAIELRASVLCWVLARDHAQFLAMWTFL